MGTSRKEIQTWFERGKKNGASHMIVACDTFEWSDYPVFAKSRADAKAEYDRLHGKDMQKVMEVYNLALPMEAQLDEHRAFNF